MFIVDLVDLSWSGSMAIAGASPTGMAASSLATPQYPAIFTSSRAYDVATFPGWWKPVPLRHMDTSAGRDGVDGVDIDSDRGDGIGGFGLEGALREGISGEEGSTLKTWAVSICLHQSALSLCLFLSALMWSRPTSWQAIESLLELFLYVFAGCRDFLFLTVPPTDAVQQPPANRLSEHHEIGSCSTLPFTSVERADKCSPPMSVRGFPTRFLD